MPDPLKGPREHVPEARATPLPGSPAPLPLGPGRGLARDLEGLRDLIRQMAKEGLWPSEICSLISALPYPLAAMELPLRAKLYLRSAGYFPVIALKTRRWGPITFCLVRCPRCKRLYLDYPHGHRGYFVCPWCGR